jgi:hypothetical protein
MLTMDQDGVVRDARVKVRLIPQIAHGPLLKIDAIVVHQTDSDTAKGTMERLSYWRKRNWCALFD